MGIGSSDSFCALLTEGLTGLTLGQRRINLLKQAQTDAVGLALVSVVMDDQDYLL